MLDKYFVCVDLLSKLDKSIIYMIIYLFDANKFNDGNILFKLSVAETNRQRIEIISSQGEILENAIITDDEPIQINIIVKQDDENFYISEFN